jgi:hypothetical protein
VPLPAARTILSPMSPFRRRLAVVATIALALVVLLWSCGTEGDGSEGEETIEPTGPGGGDAPGGDEPPAFVPVTGPIADDGTPEPPPIHAVFSVVVRGATSWDPYAGPELNSLDEEAARAISARLRQLDQVLREIGVPASIELAYGPAAALCALDPDVLDTLESGGHRLGMHARSRGEAFRAHRALGDCGRVPTTVSGLASMSDPAGPSPPTTQSLVDAFAVLSVLDLHQVVGRASPVCTDLGLAAPTHSYGTGSFTAPWRSGWTEGRPCSDLPRGRIVVIDQNPFAPAEGESRIGPAALSTLGARTDQVLGYALDHRFVEPVDLPAPGFIAWGVTVRLLDLIAPDPAPPDDPAEGEEPPPPADPVDPRTAPLSEDTLAALVELAAERWLPNMERGRLRWMLPDEVAAIFRPMPDQSAGTGS